MCKHTHTQNHAHIHRIYVKLNSKGVGRRLGRGRSEKMDQRSILHTAPSEDQSLVPSTHNQPATALTPVPGDAMPSSGLCRECSHMYKTTHRHMHTYMIKSSNIKPFNMILKLSSHSTKLEIFMKGSQALTRACDPRTKK